MLEPIPARAHDRARRVAPGTRVSLSWSSSWRRAVEPPYMQHFYTQVRCGRGVRARP